MGLECFHSQNNHEGFITVDSSFLYSLQSLMLKKQSVIVPELETVCLFVIGLF